MKKKLFLFCVLFALVLSVFPACDIPSASGSIKSLTKPYVAEYECVEARLGNEDLLEEHEFIKITLVDGEKMELSFKPKNGEKKSFMGTYKVDDKTRELTGEMGIWGFDFKESVKIEHGEFTISRNFLAMPLIMKFKMK